MEDVGIFYGQLVFLRPICIFCGHLVYFMVIWYIFPVLVWCTKKNLATLRDASVHEKEDAGIEAGEIVESLSNVNKVGPML
jgi:hypothetical protein